VNWELRDGIIVTRHHVSPEISIILDPTAVIQPHYVTIDRITRIELYEPTIDDSEAKRRISQAKRRGDDSWETLECPKIVGTFDFDKIGQNTFKATTAPRRDCKVIICISIPSDEVTVDTENTTAEILARATASLPGQTTRQEFLVVFNRRNTFLARYRPAVTSVLSTQLAKRAKPQVARYFWNGTDMQSYEMAEDGYRRYHQS